ncbi:MAG: hypothetical protein Q8M31_23690 [Beijerinckiaceae bacterium]|nr:hypothetical protein [Beijerinckiaceae bacterium]
MSQIGEKKKRGPKPKPREELKRRHLGFRLFDRTYDLLQAQAEKSGCSLSEEIERRLELSFQDEERAGGPENRKLLRLIEAVLFDVTEATGKEWSKSVYARIAVEEAIRSVLDSFVEVPPLPAHGLLATAPDAEMVREMIYARAVAADVGREVAYRLQKIDALAGAVKVLEGGGASPEQIAQLKLMAARYEADASRAIRERPRPRASSNER